MLLIAAWRSGPWLSASDRRFRIAVIACLLVMGAWFAGFEFTYVALHLIPWDDVIFFDRLPLYVAIVLLLSLCIQRLERRTMRLLVSVIVAMFSLYAVAEIAAPIPLPFFAQQLSACADGPAEEIQSTGWSCGAAALAWAARLHGIPASERQMAELAVTAPLRGTSTRGLLRALHRVGLDAYAIKPGSWEDVLAASKPSLVSWELSATVGHSVVLLGIDEPGDVVLIGDPLLGETQYSREEFLDGWMGDLIVIDGPSGSVP